MSVLEKKKDAKEIVKEKSWNFWLNFFGIGIFIAILFYILLGKRFEINDIFAYNISKKPIYFYVMFFTFFFMLSYWYGNIINKIFKLLRLYPLFENFIYNPIKKTLSFFFLCVFLILVDNFLFNSKGKLKEYDNFFYPKMDLVPEIAIKDLQDFKVFKTNNKYDPSFLFDFSEKNINETDDNGTHRIIDFFRGKDENEKLENYLYLFRVLEGRFGEWGKQIKYKDINSPMDIKNKNGYITGINKIDIFNNVYNTKNDEIIFSIKMTMDTIVYMTFLFNRFIKYSLAKGGRIKKLYGDKLSNPQVKQKVIDIFKFIYFRRLLLKFGSIPSGWIVIKTEDYDLRRIITLSERRMVVYIKYDVDDDIKIEYDDTFSTMFLFVYNAFLYKSAVSNMIEDVEWCFDPLKGLDEMKIKNAVEKIKSKTDAEDISNHN